MTRGSLAVVTLAVVSVAGWAIVPGTVAGEAPETAAETGYKARFDAAIALHDRGEFEAAIAAFRDLLATRPDDPNVLCEMGNSLFSAGRPDEAVAQAERGLRLSTADRAFCSNILGSALDARGDLKKGEKVFRKALKESPEVAILHFNLGINQAQQKRSEEAIEEFEEAIRLNPSHAGSWRALAISWQGRKVRAHAFTAFARFLALEPAGPRAEGALRQLDALLFQGVERKEVDPATGKESIQITAEARDDEDLPARSLELGMSIVAAGRWTDEWKGRTDAEFLAHAYDTVLQIFEEMDDSGGGKDAFWSASMLPYFRDARAAGHMETLVWDVQRTREDRDVAAWLETHASEVEAYHAWSAAWKPIVTKGR